MEQNKNTNDFLISVVAYSLAMLALVFVRVLGGFDVLSSIPDEPLEIAFSLVSQVLIMFILPFFVFRYMKSKPQTDSNGYFAGETQEPVITQDLYIRSDDRYVRYNDLPVVSPDYTVGKENKKTSLLYHLGFRPMSAKFVGLCFILGLLLYVMNLFVATFSYFLLDGMGYRFSSSENIFHGVWGFILSLVLIAVLPGLCEEFTHRGALMTGLRSKLGNYKAVLCVSILFGLMHMNIQQFFYATILGWFICVAVMASGSLWAGVIIHFTNNAISTYSSYAEELNLPFGNLIYDLLKYVDGFFLFLLIVIYMLVGAILKIMAKENFKKNKTVYVARYLAANPTAYNTFDAVSGQTVTFEKVSEAIETTIARMSSWKAVFAYIETHEKPQKLKPLERAIFTGLFVLGILITMYTLYWGVL
jgi:membrane protease YdiL (CAAX protease family)